MRIWHQSTGILDPASSYFRSLQEHLSAVASEGTTIEYHGMEPDWIEQHPQAYNKAAPNLRHGYQYVWTLHHEDLVRNALQAEAQGFDAFIIAMITDPGFEVIRSMLQIPVIGFWQSSMLLGATLGSPIGIITYGDAAAEQLPRVALLGGMRDLMGPIVRATFTHHEIFDGFDDPSVVIDKFNEAAARAVEQGARVLIPGEAPVNTLLARAGVSRAAGVPVIDGMGSALAIAEVRARFYQRSGLTHSETGFYLATPPKELIAGLRDYYGSRDYGGVV